MLDAALVDTDGTAIACCVNSSDPVTVSPVLEYPDGTVKLISCVLTVSLLTVPMSCPLVYLTDKLVIPKLVLKLHDTIPRTLTENTGSIVVNMNSSVPPVDDPPNTWVEPRNPFSSIVPPSIALIVFPPKFPAMISLVLDIKYLG